MFVRIYTVDEIFVDVIESSDEFLECDLNAWEKENHIEIGSYEVLKEFY